MKVIVPIAGPDYFSNKVIKGLIETSNGPLLKNVLKSRPWSESIKPQEYIFVIQQSEAGLNFYKNYIQHWFPKSRAVFLSDLTKGAALSALAGISYCIEEKENPLIIDLADIKFQSKLKNFKNIFEDNLTDAYIFTFRSDIEKYSYAKANKENVVSDVAEKKVISSNAITGVYLFRSPSIFLEAIESASKIFGNFSYKGLLYISPILNALIAKKKQIKIIQTTLEEDFS